MEREVGVKFRVSKILVRGVQPPAGIEPAIFCLRSKRFTTKLKRQEVVRDIFNKETLKNLIKKMIFSICVIFFFHFFLDLRDLEKDINLHLNV